jgi:hypothetical protein
MFSTPSPEQRWLLCLIGVGHSKVGSQCCSTGHSYVRGYCCFNISKFIFTTGVPLLLVSWTVGQQARYIVRNM